VQTNDHHEQEATMTVIAMTREIGSHGMAAGSEEHAR
jgi:hypothetical protein